MLLEHSSFAYLFSSNFITGLKPLLLSMSLFPQMAVRYPCLPLGVVLMSSLKQIDVPIIYFRVSRHTTEPEVLFLN